MADDAVKIQSFDFGNDLAHPFAFGKQRKQDVFLIQVGQCHKSVGAAKPFFHQRLFIPRIAADDRNIGKAGAEILARGGVFLDDFQRNATVCKALAQVVRGLPAPGDHHTAHGVGAVADFFEKVGSAFRRGNDGDDVPRGKGQPRVGDVGFLPAFHRADQHVTAQFGDHFTHRKPDQRTFFGNTEFQQLYQPPAEGVDLDGGREAQYPRDFLCGCLLRIDDHGKPQLVLQKIHVRTVFRAAHPRNGAAIPRFFGNQTAQKIQLVRACYGDQQVGFGNAGFLLYRQCGTVAHHAQHVKTGGNLLHLVGRGVHHGDVVMVFAQLLGKALPDLAATHNYNIHRYTS